MKNVKLAFFHFFSYGAIAAIISQLMLILSEQNYSVLEKTFVLGMGAVFSFLLSFFLGKRSDALGKVKPSFYISLLLYLISMMFAFYTPMRVAAMILMIAGSRTLMSSCETLVFVEKKNEFGKYHSMGALGMVSVSLLSGGFSLENKMAMAYFCGFCAFLLIVNYHEKEKEKREIKISDFKKLMMNFTYVRIVLIFFFLMMMGFADQQIAVDKMIGLGADETLLSFKYALQAFMEIPLYLFANKIFDKFNHLKLLLFCILMSALKFFLYGFMNSAIGMVAVASLQIVTHPLIVMLSKNMIEVCTPKKLQASSQIIGFAVYFGMSGFVTSVLGQVFILFWNESTALYFFSLVAIFPAILWYFMNKYDKVLSGDKNENISD